MEKNVRSTSGGFVKVKDALAKIGFSQSDFVSSLSRYEREGSATLEAHNESDAFGPCCKGSFRIRLVDKPTGRADYVGYTNRLTWGGVYFEFFVASEDFDLWAQSEYEKMKAESAERAF